ncbi:MAG: U32 family peptidase [Clostridia bacterium]|nr:U32 family peptidase [Clostridia bacterium]
MNFEILAPAGNGECAYASLNAGADAIYLGLEEFSARQAAENFNVESLKEICTYAHLLGAKVYVCLNTLVKDDETETFFFCAFRAWNAGADALLIQDIFLGKLLKERYPEIVLHLSTQGGCCNEYGAQLAKDYGFSRVVLARETPIEEIKKISAIIETEAFVQGALCSCFSGQCYFSSFAGNNSGNRGRCKQPCRKRYSIDRNGFEEPAYALSLSDLSLGNKLKELSEAGVLSLKIEGRMRRSEYAAAAVKYYRALREGKDASEEFRNLKRAFNRGNYTEGLAFGQKKDFLSRNVQGHIGEDVGEVSITKRGYLCKCAFVPEKGDGFKILRNGKEVGGAAVLSVEKDGFYLTSSARLLVGDRVHVTTSKAASEAALQGKRLRPVKIALSFIAGNKPRAEAEGFIFEGDELLDEAKSSPLTKEELIACFEKTDTLPFAPEIKVETRGAFLPKSKLNAFRRTFYEALTNHLAPDRKELELRPLPCIKLKKGTGEKRAYIISGGDVPKDADIVIYKPCEYAHIPTQEGKENYLYLPPYFTSKDEELVAPFLEQFDGIYCEGYYGILLAKKYRKKLFAGTGFNLTNRYAVSEAEKVASYFALSKEISLREANALSIENAFTLSGGAIKVMDLVYCPFSQDCKNCDRRERYTLTDEEGREFPLRRYALSGACRFEVYNCALLSRNICANALYDNTLAGEKLGVTKGHFERSMQ